MLSNQSSTQGDLSSWLKDSNLKMEGNVKEAKSNGTLPRTVDNTIFVGSKPLVNYIRGVILQFNKNSNEVIIRSRGKFISKAVDVAEVAKRSVEGGIVVKDIRLGSESFESNGRKTNISTMDIVLARNK